MKKGLYLTVCFIIIVNILLVMADTAFAFDGISRSLFKTGSLLKQTLKAMELMQKQRADWPKWETQFAIADYWSKAFGGLFDGAMQGGPNTYPEDPKGLPEEWFDVD